MIYEPTKGPTNSKEGIYELHQQVAPLLLTLVS